MNFILKNLDKMSKEEYEAVQDHARQWHQHQVS